jgi:hypothetical protein
MVAQMIAEWLKAQLNSRISISALVILPGLGGIAAGGIKQWL